MRFDNILLGRIYAESKFWVFCSIIPVKTDIPQSWICCIWNYCSFISKLCYLISMSGCVTWRFSLNMNILLTWMWETVFLFWVRQLYIFLPFGSPTLAHSKHSWEDHLLTCWVQLQTSCEARIYTYYLWGHHPNQILDTPG